MITICLYFMGIFLSVVGLFFIVINLNLFIIGYSFWDYLYFVFTRFECLVFFLGIILLILVYERG